MPGVDYKNHLSVWNPDLYVSNAVSSTIHSVTQPNSFMRIYPNGTILKSERLTVRFVCPLSYSSFPHSTQPCSMRLKSCKLSSYYVLAYFNCKAVF
ncbi:hypothetical protein KUTeg_024859 [Tegillarca granosa]|uniref:Neurotransmitter-gated ion-channel ligand-binding domain-containing protein n=1 Tax=Tegillarca granosa TaxID=220873 RepID=A0ABQ9DYJ3_TEGGR|nr:hypothetical protein KUTeg_024859 [Tegillarca granosa]